MKTVLAIVLTCIAAPLAAGEYCAKNHANRSEFAKPVAAQPKRVDVARPQKAKPLMAWHRVILIEPQIL